MGRLRDRVRGVLTAVTTRRAMTTLTQGAIQAIGASWATTPKGRHTPYPFVWVEESGRLRVRALERAHYRAIEQGRDDIDIRYQWMSTRPTGQGNDEGVARLNVTILAIEGESETIAFWFPLPTFVPQLRFIVDACGLSVTSMTPAQIMHEPIGRGFTIAFTPPVAELRNICDAWDANSAA